MPRLPRVPILLLLGPLAACSQDARADWPEPAPPRSVVEPDGAVRLAAASLPYVATEEIVIGASAPLVDAPARVAFRDGATSRVGAPAAGRILEVHVRVGDRVTPGQPLVTLASSDAAAARAELAAAAVARDAAAHELDRQREMVRAGVGVESERFAAEARLRAADAELARARTAASLLGQGQGARVVVRAPIAGLVLARHATVGAVAEPGGDPLVELGDPTAVWVVADVFERDLADVLPGAAARVALPGHTLGGRVAQVGSVLSTSLRTAPVSIVLDEPPPELRAGMSARVSIDGPADTGVVLPAAAVLIVDQRRTRVYVQEGEDRFRPRDVTVGRSYGGKVTIRAGLSSGERVVVEGALLLDGAANQLL